MAERPRDRLGRPLSWEQEGFPGVEQRDTITASAAIAEARAYLDEGLPFHAHEVLEMRWRCCPSDERSLWRGLAQAAAGATHAARGNPVGAERLRDRGRASVEEWLAEGVEPPVAGQPGQLDEATRALIDQLMPPTSASGQLSGDSPGVSPQQLPTREEGVD